MTLQRNIRSLALLTAFAMPMALGACILKVGDGLDDDGFDEGFDDGDWEAICGGGSNNRVNLDDQCVCIVGYDWCTPQDQNGGHNCCEITPDPCVAGSNNHVADNGECACNNGFTWCSDDTADLNCCPLDGTTDPTNASVGTADTATTDPGTGTATSGDATTVGTTGMETATGDADSSGGTADETSGEDSVHPDDENCSPDGATLCSHSAAMGPQGSTYYECIGGKWQDSTANLDDSCRNEGFDFAYGCVDNEEAMKIEILCGVGPGTQCDPNTVPNTCVDDKTLAKCVDGRVTHENCDPSTPSDPPACQVDGMEFEFGECGVQDGTASCLCYDEDPNG